MVAAPKLFPMALLSIPVSIRPGVLQGVGVGAGGLGSGGAGEWGSGGDWVRIGGGGGGIVVGLVVVVKAAVAVRNAVVLVSAVEEAVDSKMLVATTSLGGMVGFVVAGGLAQPISIKISSARNLT